MPSSVHKEYIRESPQNKTVVLFIHGILGTPNQFRDFVKIVPAEYSVHNILLDGHGATVREFSKSSVSLWRNRVSEKIEYLSERYDSIMIVAHSLGTLLAIEAGIRFPDKVKQLFLIAVPLKITVKPSVISTSLKVALNRVRPDDDIATAAKASYGISPTKRPYEYLGWAPRFYELLKEAKRARSIVPSLTVPTLVFQSQKDELVSMKSCGYLCSNPRISIQLMPNSRHYYYDKTEYQNMLNHFSNMLQT
ncbi:MAG: alpha/beta hydrolase [Bacillota bacterium]